MEEKFDVIVIGGGVIGCAAAYFLSANTSFNGSVLVVEPDPTHTHASSTLSASSLRTQFSNSLNIKISQYGYDFISHFHDLIKS